MYCSCAKWIIEQGATLVVESKDGEIVEHRSDSCSAPTVGMYSRLRTSTLPNLQKSWRECPTMGSGQCKSANRP